MYVNLYLFVCLFDRVNQSLPTTIDSGLHGPQGPFSTPLGDWDLLFKEGRVVEKLTVYIYYSIRCKEKGRYNFRCIQPIPFKLGN